MKVEQANRATAGSQMGWLPLKDLIICFDICYISFALLINTKHLLTDGAHPSKNLPSRLWAYIEVIYELCLWVQSALDSWPLLLVLSSCPHCFSGPKDNMGSHRIQAWSLPSMHLRRESSFSAQVLLSVDQHGAERVVENLTHLK